MITDEMEQVDFWFGGRRNRLNKVTPEQGWQTYEKCLSWEKSFRADLKSITDLWRSDAAVTDIFWGIFSHYEEHNCIHYTNIA